MENKTEIINNAIEEFFKSDNIEDTIFSTYPATNYYPACSRLKDLIMQLHAGKDVKKQIERCLWLILWQLRQEGIEPFEIDEKYAELYANRNK